jgi:hypothetical protein
MHYCECLDGWSGGGWGVFIAPNHLFNRWGRLLSMGATDSPVRQPCHPTVRVWPLELCLLMTTDSSVSHRTGTVHCPVCLWQLLWILRELSAHCSSVGDRCSWSRCSAGAPDSPVAHRTVRWIIAKRGLRNPKVKSLKSFGPGAPSTVRWHTEQSGAPDQCSRRFLLLLSFEP